MRSTKPLTWLTIDGAAIRHNVRTFKRRTHGLGLYAVVKANAYGHGLLPVAKTALAAGCERLAVVSVEEALALRAGGVRAPILVLSYVGTFVAKDQLREAIKSDIAFAIFDLETAHLMNRLGGECKKRVAVHMKIDTGTTRLGVLPSVALDFAQQLKSLTHLMLEGCFTHFAQAEEDNLAPTEAQLKRFAAATGTLERAGFSIPQLHAACSAALLRVSLGDLNWGRLGLSLYGLVPSPAMQKALGKERLKPALSWYTTVIQVKGVAKGTGIGYGAHYRMPQDGAIATLAMGYADGMPRAHSNRGAVLVNGQRAPIRGNICMNLTMVDVSKIRNVRAGATVTVIGRDGKQEITCDEFAADCDTINYEVPTRINWTLPRLYKHVS